MSGPLNRLGLSKVPTFTITAGNPGGRVATCVPQLAQNSRVAGRSRSLRVDSFRARLVAGLLKRLVRWLAIRWRSSGVLLPFVIPFPIPTVRPDPWTKEGIYIPRWAWSRLRSDLATADQHPPTRGRATTERQPASRFPNL